jgi:hypothetical protein
MARSLGWNDVDVDVDLVRREKKKEKIGMVNVSILSSELISDEL